LDASGTFHLSRKYHYDLTGSLAGTWGTFSWDEVLPTEDPSYRLFYGGVVETDSAQTILVEQHLHGDMEVFEYGPC
jgi:hypothetical protein